MFKSKKDLCILHHSIFFIAEWKTPLWHFVVNGFNSTNIFTNDWEVEVTYGEPYVANVKDEVTGINQSVLWANNVYLFRRPLTNHLLQTFVPSFMLSIASASSVFIPSNIVPGRMSLCITSFLSLISLFNGARYNIKSENNS